jgi:hypothetical protein
MSIDGKDRDMDLFLIKFDKDTGNEYLGWEGVHNGFRHRGLWWVRYSERLVRLNGPQDPDMD